MIVGVMGNHASVSVGDIVEGRYRIIGILGQGGMGTVWLAEHALIRRKVALKLLRPELATDDRAIERFMNEARAAGTLGHPNIVESTDMGFTSDGVPYIVFEHLEGALLTDEIYRLGGLPVRRVVRIAQQIASALGAAHEAGIVHRDLKSDNVFLTDRDGEVDRVKVLDFGVSRVQGSPIPGDENSVMGTPEYMAPEQLLQPDAVDRRTDVYALGVVMYEMLAARRPFGDPDQKTLWRKIARSAPPALGVRDVSKPVEQLIEKMLAKDPGERYQTMADVADALAEIAAAAAATTSVSSRALRDTPWPEGNTVDLTPLAQLAQPVSLPTPPRAKRAWLFALAGGLALAGTAIGGIAIGRRDDRATVADVPAPRMQVPAPAAALPAAAAPQKIAIQVDADAPNARVTFRRRVMPAPEQMQLAPSDVVELVEVSAPGYKTTRYWLTFDRPTQLRAHLAKGDGLVEASEEATLVALGEAEAPPVAPAAAAPAAVERPVAPVAPVAPRKIGKSAPASASAPAGSAVADIAPSPSPDAAPASEPAPTPAPEPVAIAAAPVPMQVPTPTQVPTATPTPAAAPASPPSQQSTSIDPAILSGVIDQHRADLQRCLASTLLSPASTLQLAIAPNGRVKQVQLHTAHTDPAAAGCIVRVATHLQFPAWVGTDTASVSYPLAR